MKKQWHGLVIAGLVSLLLQPVYGKKEVYEVCQKHEKEIAALEKRQNILWTALAATGCVAGICALLAIKFELAYKRAAFELRFVNAEDK